MLDKKPHGTPSELSNPPNHKSLDSSQQRQQTAPNTYSIGSTMTDNTD